ncbi:ThuA domain-containing protein [Emticicia sp. SJ17W-69]|uniref:ThuA domain-containing protein n=1 Tax=Emticicia sp. SJ17W-69 TaxID=3421657 RepID=UPI003EC08C81
MKKITSLTFAFFITNIVFGQSRTLVFYDINQSAEVSILLNKAQEKKIVLDTTSNPTKFTESHLKHYTAVVFLSTSINRLDYRQSAEFQRFMQAGGGFVGINTAIEKSHKWLWYNKMLGGVLSENQLDNKIQLSVITNASIGKTELPPLWKIEDKPLIINALPVKCKPILLDVMGKTWAWYYTTEEGGKMFYTALGGEISVYENSNFINHLWAGIEEVSAKNLPDYSKIADSALPKESSFLKLKLSESLENPVALATTPEGNVLMAEQSGQIKLYHSQKRLTKLIGKIDVSNLKAIKLDPEFTQNNYVYTFSEMGKDDYKIGRFQMIGDSSAILTDFSSQSSTALTKTIVYSFAKSEKAPYHFPKYYDGKSFRYDNEKGLTIETFDDDGNIKNIEPFLPNIRFNFIKDMAFGADGALYFLEDNQLLKIDYSETNRKPFAIASADVQTGNFPLKVKFSSAGSIDNDPNDMLKFAWNFDGKNTSTEPNPEFTFTKLGVYEVKLQVTDNQGDTADAFVKIQVNKAPVKRK